MRRLVLFATLAAAAWVARADEAFSIVTCQRRLSEADFAMFDKLGFHSDGRSGEGWALSRRVTSGRACLTDVRHDAVAGVLAFRGRLCSADAQPLLRALGLASNAPPHLLGLPSPRPGYLLEHWSDRLVVAIYQGEPAFEPSPDVNSKVLSFSCFYGI